MTGWVSQGRIGYVKNSVGARLDPDQPVGAQQLLLVLPTRSRPEGR